MSLSQPCQAGGAPRAYFSCAGKVGKSALGRPQTPSFCLIGHDQGRYPVATKFPLGLRPPRNRCSALRTSPDGPRADRHFLSCKIDPSVPSKGRQPKPDEKPGGDQIPEGFGSSVATHWQNLMASDWAKAGAGVSPAAFSPARRRALTRPTAA